MHLYSALELSKRFKNGEISAKEIARHFLKRIQLFDKELGCFLSTLTEQVLQRADFLDMKRAKGLPLGRLAGVIIAVKDNIHIKGVKTTCASQFLKNYIAPFSATVSHLIEDEDGLIIGKTNLDEFAMGSTNENSSFYPVKNPWNVEMVPGGSSGGSAAAVAAGLATLSLGSDTGGSIRLPAAFTGTVGFKPSYGRVSRYGLVAFGSSFDQIGPIARSVEDIALIMEVLGRHCLHDSTSYNKPQERYLEELKKPIHNKKIGVPFSLIENLEDENLSAFKEALSRIEDCGIEVVDIDLDVLKYAMPVYYILATAEASTNLARFDGIQYTQRVSNPQNLEELYMKSRAAGFGTEVKQRILLGTYVLSADRQDAYYKKAQKVRTLVIDAVDEALKLCDAIVMPTAPGAAFNIGEIRDPLSLYLQDIFTIPANLTGSAAISLPFGFTKTGRPLGLQLMGAHMDDAKILHLAHHIEKAFGFGSRVAPDYLKEAQ
jgi:aspartyl-tRNA(Asn)/glutamyl-tRNA(Gln) amidotransferase subunit A